MSMSAYPDAVKFLLKTVIATGHLPATAQAQLYLDAIEAEEQPESPVEPRPAVPSEPAKVAAISSPAGAKPDASDAHNAAVNKTK